MAPRRTGQGAGSEERQALLSNSHSGYDSIPHQPQHDAHPTSSPYLSFSLRLGFFVGVFILLLATIFLLLLVINLFFPIPLLLPPNRSPAVLPVWLCITTIMVVGPGLLVFELASRATRLIHLAVLLFNLVCLIVVSAVFELRSTHAWLGISALTLNVMAAVWALATSAILAKVQIPYTIQPQGGLSIVAHISSQQAQGKWARLFKVLLAVTGTFFVASTVLLLAFDVLVDAMDAGFKPVGNLTLIHIPAIGGSTPEPNDPATKNPTPVQLRLHLACEEAPPHEGHIQKTNKTSRPTALVMTERGVAGVIGAQWVRDMVNRASLPTNDSDDGHLALEKVCFWDRLGYGHTDFVGQPFSIRLQTKMLYQALQTNGQIQGPNSNELHSPDDLKKGNNIEPLGQFMIITTGFGNLFAQDFTSQHPELVHSFLFVDAETPESWYGDLVNPKSGLRAGYNAPGHGFFGRIWADLIPVITEPLGIARLIGLFRGKTVVDRILAPAYHGGAKRTDAGGGGCRIRGAGGSNARLLMVSWYERLDANLGHQSHNYEVLTHKESKFENLLAARPVAVLSSFWKIHADLKGWGEEQKETLVKPAKDSGSLIGWWRVGERNKKAGGGDLGGPAGLCSTNMGQVFCQEAVRKLLAAGDTWNATLSA